MDVSSNIFLIFTYHSVYSFVSLRTNQRKMTQGQRESIFLIYVNVCNALIYAEDILVEDSASKSVKDAIRVVRDRLNWIKRNMDLKVHRDVSKTVDTLRYDGIVRMLANMPEEYQEKFEDAVVDFLKSIEIK